jgi:hypothetical protein
VRRAMSSNRSDVEVRCDRGRWVSARRDETHGLGATPVISLEGYGASFRHV